MSNIIKNLLGNVELDAVAPATFDHPVKNRAAFAGIGITQK